MPRNSVRPRGDLRFSVGRGRALALSATALLLVAAGELSSGFDRIRALPASERARLLEKLRDFDLALTAEQKTAIREMDRRIGEMPVEERSRYLAVLRRYHAWYNALPPQQQEELAALAPSERMATVRRLLKDRPVPSGSTPPMLRMLEPGEFSPFEVASAYRIWQASGPEDRARVERATPEAVRRNELFRLGQKVKPPIPREIVPARFDEDQAASQARDWLWEGMKPVSMLEEIGKGKVAETVRKKAERRRTEALRRIAISYHVSRVEEPIVSQERLDQFIAGLPPWITTTYTSLAPDEARRRMAIAYRLVFPAGQEIGANRKAAGPTAGKVAPRPTPVPASPPPPRPKPAPPASETPF